MSARLLVMALLLFNAVTAVSAELGRMFLTPAQRATLDEARNKNLRVELGTQNVQPAAAPVPQNVSVDGLVRRSDGASTVWINNRPVTGRQADGLGITPARNDNRVKVTAPDSGRSVDLKVGQSVEIISGTIQEGYARRTAAKPAAKAAPGAEDNAPAAGTAPASAGLPQIKSAAVPAKPLPRAGVRDGEDQTERSLPPGTQTDAPGAAIPGGNKRSP